MKINVDFQEMVDKTIIPIYAFLWLVVLFYSIFGISLGAVNILIFQIQAQQFAASVLFINGIGGIIFNRKLFPDPVPDIHCDKCSSTKVKTLKKEIQYRCMDCDSKFEFKMN